MKIQARDLKFFVLGIITAFVISSIYNWEESINSFKKGYNEGEKDAISYPSNIKD